MKRALVSVVVLTIVCAETHLAFAADKLDLSTTITKSDAEAILGGRVNDPKVSKKQDADGYDSSFQYYTEKMDKSLMFDVSQFTPEKMTAKERFSVLGSAESKLEPVKGIGEEAVFIERGSGSDITHTTMLYVLKGNAIVTVAMGEVTDPNAYLTPDITADFTAVEIKETGPDTIAVTGGRGRKRPDTLKVSVGYHAGYIGEGEISYGGENCVARAQLAGEIVSERLRGQFQELRVDILGVTGLHTRPMSGGDYNPYEVRLRVAGRSTDRQKAALIGEEVETLWTNGPAGGGGARKSTQEQIGIVSCLLARDKVKPQVTVFET